MMKMVNDESESAFFTLCIISFLYYYSFKDFSFTRKVKKHFYFHHSPFEADLKKQIS